MQKHRKQRIKQLFTDLLLFRGMTDQLSIQAQQKGGLVADGGGNRASAARKAGPHPACSKQD